jgi:DNA-binding NarL/FixJ family response regulator
MVAGGIMATASTVRAALATIEAADAAASLTQLPGLLIPALVDLVGADSALWTELDVAPGRGQTPGPLPGRVVGYPEPLLTEDTALSLEQHARDFPLTCHTRPGGDGRPIRRSDLQSMRSFRSSGMYADVAQKIGVDQMLATALKPGSLHICISLNRADFDFTPTAVDLLTRLRPLLTRRVARLAAGHVMLARGTPAPQLTARQEQVLRLVADGLTDAAIGHRLGCSPRTVDKHLEHVYRRLGVSCRTAAIAAACAALMDTAAASGLQVQDTAALQAAAVRRPGGPGSGRQLTE